ncbi:MAG: hypothetical protein AAF850_03295 [Pseudomonadota bacterium]
MTDKIFTGVSPQASRGIKQHYQERGANVSVFMRPAGDATVIVRMPKTADTVTLSDTDVPNSLDAGFSAGEDISTAPGAIIGYANPGDNDGSVARRGKIVRANVDTLKTSGAGLSTVRTDNPPWSLQEMNLDTE